MKATILLLFLLSSLSGNKANVEQGSSLYTPFQEDHESSAVRRGKERLQDYESRDSPCWKAAVNELQSKCSEMTDIEKSILAMKFANCHFKKSGLTTYDCTEKANFQDCTSCMKAIDSSSFLVYTEFFTHVTGICFHLKSRIWRQNTAEKIEVLNQTTDSMTTNLDHLLYNQSVISSMQNISLINQRKNVRAAKEFTVIVDNFTASVKCDMLEVIDKVKRLEKEVNQTFQPIIEGIEWVIQLQEMFLDEYMLPESIAFYMFSIACCYFSTSSPITTNARPLLVVLLGVLILVESGFAKIMKNVKGSPVSFQIYWYICTKDDNTLLCVNFIHNQGRQQLWEMGAIGPGPPPTGDKGDRCPFE